MGVDERTRTGEGLAQTRSFAGVERYFNSFEGSWHFIQTASGWTT
jgi:hypothetical protein